MGLQVNLSNLYDNQNILGKANKVSVKTIKHHVWTEFFSAYTQSCTSKKKKNSNLDHDIKISKNA